MKKTLVKKLPVLVLTGGLVLTIVTFAQDNSGKQNPTSNDTFPKKEKKIHDLDEALAELDRGQIELTQALREIDSEKIEKEVRAAMKALELDMGKMKQEMVLALKEVDMQKINAELQKELVDMQKELKGIDGDKLKREIELSIEKIDFEKIKDDLKKVEEIDFSKMKNELQAIRPTIETSMRNARQEMEKAKVEIEKAKQEIGDYKNLVNALSKDGYLDKNQNYKVEYKNKELIVNGKKLPGDAVRKYSEFLSDKEDFTIKKEEDNFNINK